jgi:hypothetical protein
MTEIQRTQFTNGQRVRTDISLKKKRQEWLKSARKVADVCVLGRSKPKPLCAISHLSGQLQSRTWKVTSAGEVMEELEPQMWLAGMESHVQWSLGERDTALPHTVTAL